MKKLIITIAGTSLLSLAGYSQGIQFADLTFTAGDTEISGVANKTENLNLELLLGTSAGGITNAVATLLLDNNTASPSSAFGAINPAGGDISMFGSIYDNSGLAYNLTSYAGDTVYLEVEAWTGTGIDSFSAAMNSKMLGEYSGISQVFTEVVPTTLTAQPIDISGVGVIDLTQVPTAVVPEPSTLALAGVGLASMLIARRKK